MKPENSLPDAGNRRRQLRWNSAILTAGMPHGPRMKPWTGQEVAGRFRPFTAPKRHGMSIRTCRAMKNKKEKTGPGPGKIRGHHNSLVSRYWLIAPSYSWVRRNTFLANRNRVWSVVSPPEVSISFKTGS